MTKLSIFLTLLFYFSESLAMESPLVKHKAPLQGPPGPQGPPGVASTNMHYFNYHLESLPLFIARGDNVPFNQVPFSNGDCVVKGHSNTFTFIESGIYFISFVGYTTQGGGAAFVLNTLPTGPYAIAPATGGPLILQQTLHAQSGDSFKVVATLDTVYSENTSATINFVRLY